MSVVGEVKYTSIECVCALVGCKGGLENDAIAQYGEVQRRLVAIPGCCFGGYFGEV